MRLSYLHVLTSTNYQINMANFLGLMHDINLITSHNHAAPVQPITNQLKLDNWNKCDYIQPTNNPTNHHHHVLHAAQIKCDELNLLSNQNGWVCRLSQFCQVCRYLKQHEWGKYYLNEEILIIIWWELSTIMFGPSWSHQILKIVATIKINSNVKKNSFISRVSLRLSPNNVILLHFFFFF